jgi:hypothetical protein
MVERPADHPLGAIGISGISIVMLPFGVIWVLLGIWLGRDYVRRDRLEPAPDATR